MDGQITIGSPEEKYHFFQLDKKGAVVVVEQYQEKSSGQVASNVSFLQSLSMQCMSRLQRDSKKGALNMR